MILSLFPIWQVAELLEHTFAEAEVRARLVVVGRVARTLLGAVVGTAVAGSLSVEAGAALRAMFNTISQKENNTLRSVPMNTRFITEASANQLAPKQTSRLTNMRLSMDANAVYLDPGVPGK